MLQLRENHGGTAVGVVEDCIILPLAAVVYASRTLAAVRLPLQ